MFAAPTTLEPELLAAGNDDAVWAAWAGQQPRAWETVKAAVDAAAPAGRAAVFALKLKDADLRKGDFAQDFLDAAETSGAPLRRPRVPGERAALAHGRPCPGSGLMNGPDLAAARAQARAAQQQVITADPPFAVIACPGAGKTRVIVDRHLTRAVPVRQGRAITSFTRVAAAEVHRRCTAADRLDLTGHPHFIGTLDTFLWLHLVRPFLPPGPDLAAAGILARRAGQVRQVHLRPDLPPRRRRLRLRPRDRQPGRYAPPEPPAAGPATRQLGLARLPHPRRTSNAPATSPAPNCARTPAATSRPARPTLGALLHRQVRRAGGR